MKKLKQESWVWMGLLAIAASGCDLSALQRSQNRPQASVGAAEVAYNGGSSHSGTLPERGSGSGFGSGSGIDFDDGLGLGGIPSKKRARQKGSSESLSVPSSGMGSSDGSWPSPGYGGFSRTRVQEAAIAARGAERDPERSSTSHRTIGETCSRSANASADPHDFCLGIRYVTYVDSHGEQVESQNDAIRDVDFANRIWRSCGIQFQIDDFVEVRPQEYQLRYRTRNYEELGQIRRTFAQPGELLVVATGAWDRSGNLGNNWANAWTNLPGEREQGIVLEETVSQYPQILAHELGHYLSLDHSETPSSLMFPIVSRLSLKLTRQECQAARWAAKTYWRDMMR